MRSRSILRTADGLRLLKFRMKKTREKEMQGSDNDYYLHRTFEGKNNFSGSIFVEYRNSGDFTDSNTIVYGHNMKNQSMFGKLKLLQEQGLYSEQFRILDSDAGT